MRFIPQNFEAHGTIIEQWFTSLTFYWKICHKKTCVFSQFHNVMRLHSAALIDVDKNGHCSWASYIRAFSSFLLIYFFYNHFWRFRFWIATYLHTYQVSFVFEMSNLTVEQKAHASPSLFVWYETTSKLWLIIDEAASATTTTTKVRVIISSKFDIFTC